MLRVGYPDRLNIAKFQEILQDHPTEGIEPTGTGDPNVSPPKMMYAKFVEELATLMSSVGTG